MLLLLLLLLPLAFGLGLIMTPSSGGLQLLQKLLCGRGGLITAASNATPTVVTAGSGPVGGANVSANHGLANGNCIIIAGATGNTNINGTWTVGTVTATTFQLYPTSSGTNGVAVAGNGVLGGSPYWTLAGVEAAALKLYSSNTTPAESDTAATYTELVAGSGYTTGGLTITAQFAVTTGFGWNSPTTTAAGGTGGWAGTAGTGGGFSASTNVPEATTTASLVWSWTGTVTGVYGYFVVGATTGNIWWSERFAGAPRSFGNGDTLSLPARLGLTHS